MKNSIITLSGIALLTGVMTVGLSACSNNYSGATVVQNSTRYYPYDYYYYPNTSVYFHVSSGNYHYRDGKKWKKARSLPPRYKLNSRDRVRIKINSDKPHVNNNKHRTRYTPRPNYKHDNKRNIIERRNNSTKFKRHQRK